MRRWTIGYRWLYLLCPVRGLRSKLHWTIHLHQVPAGYETMLSTVTVLGLQMCNAASNRLRKTKSSRKTTRTHALVILAKPTQVSITQTRHKVWNHLGTELRGFPKLHRDATQLRRPDYLRNSGNFGHSPKRINHHSTLELQELHELHQEPCHSHTPLLLSYGLTFKTLVNMSKSFTQVCTLTYVTMELVHSTDQS